MSIVAYLAALVIMMLVALRYFVPAADRAFCYRVMAMLLPIQLITLYFLNASIPFVPSETDTVFYYQLSQRDFDSFTDYFNVAKTSNYIYRQFGGSAYTHILSVIHQFVGDSLFFRKVFSLSWLWPLGFAWYATSRLIAGRTFARSVFVVTVALPTLWYPFCVLYRDLVTAALHSVFLASVLLLYQDKRRRATHAAVLVVTALALFFLRPITIYINAAVIAVTMVADRLVLLSSSGKKVTRLVLLTATVIAMALGFLIFRDEGVAGALQIANKITAEGLQEQQIGISSSLESRSGPVSWPARVAAGAVLFIGSEPTIVSRDLDLENIDTLGQLRGLMNGPWFLFGTPLVALAILTVARSFLGRWGILDKIRPGGKMARTSVDAGRRFGLWVVAGYSLIWFALCVLGWDWTRWRLPVVPGLAMLAVWQYRRLTPAGRTALAFGWSLAIVGWRLLQ